MGILQNIGLFETIKLEGASEINWYQVLNEYTLLRAENTEFKAENYISFSYFFFFKF